MNRNEILERLTPIFREAFRNSNLVISETMTADDVEKWDSLSNTIMIDSVEKEFGIRFSFKEIVNMKNIGDMINLIIKHKSF
jgi:acyl carrier protein